jgi:hypothetical protein
LGCNGLIATPSCWLWLTRWRSDQSLALGQRPIGGGGVGLVDHVHRVRLAGELFDGLPQLFHLIGRLPRAIRIDGVVKLK